MRPTLSKAKAEKLAEYSNQVAAFEAKNGRAELVPVQKVVVWNKTLRERAAEKRLRAGV